MPASDNRPLFFMHKLSMAELDRLSPEEFRAAPKTPLVVMLEDIRSAANVGSVFRTADAFRLEGVLLTGITAKPPHKEILKTALGATDTVAWRYAQTSLEGLQMLIDEGYELWAVEQAKGSTYLHEFTIDPSRKYALILGNEVEGVSQTVLAMVKGCIEVPQMGAKHSLNVSVCAGVVAWRFFERLMLEV